MSKKKRKKVQIQTQSPPPTEVTGPGLLVIKVARLALIVWFPFILMYQVFPMVSGQGFYGFMHYVNETLANRKRLQAYHSLVVGDSTLTFAIDPDQVRNSQSIGMPHGSPIEAYYQLKKYLTIYPQPMQILLSSMGYHPGYQDYFWLNGALAGFYTKSEMGEIFHHAKRLNDFPMYSEPMNALEFFGRYVSMRLNFPFSVISNFQQGVLNPRNSYYFNRLVYESMKFTNGYVYLSREDENVTVGDHQFVSSVPDQYKTRPLYEHYLKQILKMTQKRKIKLIYVHTPVHPRAKTELYDRYQGQFRDYMQNLVSSYPHAHYVQPEAQINELHFWDDVHMSGEGARVFTSALLSKL